MHKMKIPQILTLILNNFVGILVGNWKELVNWTTIERAYIKKKNRISTILLFLVAEIRLERMTFGLWAQRATNCSTPRCLTGAKVRLFLRQTNKLLNIFRINHHLFLILLKMSRIMMIVFLVPINIQMLIFCLFSCMV